MQYTRGKAGPVSRMRIEVSTADVTDAGPNSRVSGGGVAEMARGRLKAIEFVAQGKHVEAARAALRPGGVIEADVRWTGGTAVTIVKVHSAEAGAASLPAITPLAQRRKASLDEQVSRIFG